MAGDQHRVRFDFEIEFTNGGGLSGRDFRLDIPGDDVTDAWIADAIVRNLRLVMVGSVRILDRRILREPHKRGVGGELVPAPAPPTATRTARFVDLSHPIEAGMVTYPGLPGPVIEHHLTREASVHDDLDASWQEWDLNGRTG